MSSMLRGNVRMALASIKNTKWRSGATMFGVIVAIVPVLIILGIGEGVKRQVVKQINTLGSNTILVQPGANSSETGVKELQALWQPQSYGAFTADDIEATQAVNNVYTVAPLSIAPGEVRSEETSRNLAVLGVTPELPKATHYETQYGEFFTEADAGRRVAVVGRAAAERMFEGDASSTLGRIFEYRSQTFVIVGVLEELEAPILGVGPDLNGSVLIPQRQAELLANNATTFQLIVRPKSDTNIKQVSRDVTQALIVSRGGQKDFKLVTQEEALSAANRILTLMAGLVGGIAAISLLVAGIGIMNIMLVGVTERMHEIGVRKAIGATKRQIAGQFMSEAIVLSSVGAVLGVILAYLVAYILSVTTNLQPIITWQAAIFVTSLSIVIGMVFSAIPAFSAASKDPIDALRNE